MLQLTQSLRLNLPDPLARHRELLADFLERVIREHPNAEAHFWDAFFVRVSVNRPHQALSLPAVGSRPRLRASTAA